jgi:guanylate kinase
MTIPSALLISGPSGCGKSSMLTYVYKHIQNYYFSISTTTRDKRDGETHGVDYFFVSKEQFEQDIKEDQFLEWAKVHDNYYGTSKKPIQKAITQNKLVIFDIDVQGFHILKSKISNHIPSVFITTKTKQELKTRLTARAKDSQNDIAKRLTNASVEMRQAILYDYIIINDDLTVASNILLNIVKNTKQTLKDQTLKEQIFKKIIDSWGI